MKSCFSIDFIAENQRREHEEEAKKTAFQNSVHQLSQLISDIASDVMAEISQEGFSIKVRKYVNKFAQLHDNYLAGKTDLQKVLLIQRSDLEKTILDQYDALDDDSKTKVMFTVMRNWLDTHRNEAAHFDLSEMWRLGYRIAIEPKKEGAT